MTWPHAGLAVVVLAVGARIGAQEPNAFAAEAQRAIASTALAGRVERPIERTALARLYGSARVEPLWSVDGAPTRQALESMAMLAASDRQGLVPMDYHGNALAGLASSMAGSPVDVARFDVTLSRATIRLLADLHMGRIDPQLLRFYLPDVHEQLDLAALVSMVAVARDVRETLAAAEPPYAGYAALRDALARYRRLAADPDLRLPARPPKALRLGDRYADAPVLRRLLLALGDLDPELVEPGTVPNDSAVIYDTVLVQAVTRFQRRHGLEPDGVAGPATMAQLRTPLARRVRQIELTLERWRWLPDQAPARFAVVNIPAFRLYAFEADPTARNPVLAMNAIVGEARSRHGTPVFVGTMREVVFQPYWDVPPRIARNELIPLFRRRPAYYEDEGFEIVRVGDVGDGARVYPPTSANFARVVAGELRLRQRPGPKNALGPAKFVFPNPHHVFMHGTPAQELFAHSRRDFSHGCIRIEEPAALAELVLRGQPSWDTSAIEAAMSGTRTQHVPVARPVTVFVLYATVMVDREGTVRFFADIYGHDAALERALQLPAVGARGDVAAP